MTVLVIIQHMAKTLDELRREAFIPIKDTVEGINKAQFLNLPQEHSPSDDIHHKK